MSESHIPAKHGLDAFHCPHRGVYAHQEFVGAMRTMGGAGRLSSAITEIDGYSVSVCSRCNRALIWYRDTVVHPSFGSTPAPHPDMPADVAADYEEARLVSELSPRASAALLRLALQKLCVTLGQPGKQLDVDIGNLVAQGLDARIQRALDVLRITGNNAVHPGELNFEDGREIVAKLFTLLNTVVQSMITQPREINSLWDAMPEGARNAAERRDRSK